MARPLMKHTRSRDLISRLQFFISQTIKIRNFGDPEGTLLLQAKANKILRRRKTFCPHSRHRHGQASLSFPAVPR